MTKLEQMGRLAYRVEGGNWNAYYALPNTMVGAIYLGSIRMKIVENLERRAAFKALMWEGFCDILEERYGVRPTRGEEQDAPEHERTKE